MKVALHVNQPVNKTVSIRASPGALAFVELIQRGFTEAESKSASACVCDCYTGTPEISTPTYWL